MAMRAPDDSVPVEQLVAEWVEQSRSLSILVGGRTGSGKSTLVNAFLGTKVCEVGPGSQSVTGRVQKVTKSVQCIDLEVFDTPGLSDRRKGRDDLTIIAECRAHVKSDLSETLDLFFFCKSIAPGCRTTTQDEDEIGLLTRAFTKEIWKRSIIVLTCANTMDFSDKVAYTEVIRSYTEDLKTILKSIAKVDTCVVEDIPVCVAGRNDNDVPFENSRENGIDQNWRSKLYYAAFERIRAESAPALLQLSLRKRLTKTALIAAITGGSSAGVAAAVGAGTGAIIGLAMPAPGTAIVGAGIGAAVGGGGAFIIGAGSGAGVACWKQDIRLHFRLWARERAYRYQKLTETTEQT